MGFWSKLYLLPLLLRCEGGHRGSARSEGQLGALLLLGQRGAGDLDVLAQHLPVQAHITHRRHSPGTGATQGSAVTSKQEII